MSDPPHRMGLVDQAGRRVEHDERSHPEGETEPTVAEQFAQTASGLPRPVLEMAVYRRPDCCTLTFVGTCVDEHLDDDRGAGREILCPFLDPVGDRDIQRPLLEGRRVDRIEECCDRSDTHLDRSAFEIDVSDRPVPLLHPHIVPSIA